MSPAHEDLFGDTQGTNHVSDRIAYRDFKLRRTIECAHGQRDALQHIEFSRHDSRLLTTCADQTIRVWTRDFDTLSNMRHDIDSGASTFRSRSFNAKAANGAPPSLSRAYFSPSGHMVLGCDTVIRMWGTSSGNVLEELAGHELQVTSGAFLANERIITGSHDKTLKIWDLSRMACIKTFLCMSNCNDVEVSESNEMAIGCHFNKTLSFWDLRTPYGFIGAIKETGHSQQITAVNIINNMVCTVGKDNNLHVFDTRTYQQLYQLTTDFQDPTINYSNCSRFTKARFSPDGLRVAIGGRGMAYVWNLQDNERHSCPMIVHHPQDDLSITTCIDWDKGTKRTLTCCTDDGKIHIYDFT